jgi:hypothetical protein
LGFGAALALQTGIVALWAGYLFVAVLLTGLGCFIVAWQTPSQSSGQTAGKRAANLIVALVLVICGFVFAGRPRGGPDPVSPPLAKAAVEHQNLLTGIILLSEPKRYVPPVPASLLHKKGPVQLVNQRPTSIPFSGEYWLFPSLFRVWKGKRVPVSQHPPMTSLVKHGDPLDSTYSSTRRWMPLVMKAHQTLGAPVELSCCQRVDVAVTEADLLPGTVAMEVILLDTTRGRGAAQSLGETVIPTSLPEAVVRFNVPRRPSIERFDAIEVVFDLEEPRQDRSAKMAIDRFDLVPRFW